MELRERPEWLSYCQAHLCEWKSLLGQQDRLANFQELEIIYHD